MQLSHVCYHPQQVDAASVSINAVRIVLVEVSQGVFMGKTIQKPCFCQKPPWINFDYLETLYSNYKSEKPCPAKV